MTAGPVALGFETERCMSLVGSIVMILLLPPPRKEVMCQPASVCVCIFVSKITEVMK